MELPTLVITHGELPIYLQVKYQMLHLISSGTLREGYRLPPVRILAEHLNINPGTVAQAYKELQAEGLVEGQKGRGTFVRPITNPDVADYAVRQRLLTSTLEEFLNWAYALGFGDVEIRQSVVSLLSRKPLARHMLFVGYNELDARKYAAHLTDNLAEFHLEVTATTVEHLEAGRGEIPLEEVYYVFTYAGLVLRTEAVLKTFPRPYRVVGIVSEVTAETVRSLAKLPDDAKVVLLTEERYLHSALNLIQRHSRLPISEITTLYNGDSERAQRVVDEADVVLYSLGMRQQVEELALNAEHCVELTFDISEDSLLKLRRMFTPVTSPSWAGSGQAVQ